MKKARKQNHNQLKRKQAKAIARKGKGAQYGAKVKQFNQLGPLLQNRIEQVVVQGTDSREVLNESFVDDPTQTLKEKIRNADKGTIEIS